ncbi:MAG: Na+/H+ antiporter subunit E [Phycisphaeraceae bacterium]|nr:Na+/H+ antiporter subunit E [Phycisphaeraceae bacterium]MCW5753225.1 Na+/H+ antiporter subunit E [Phycisphaeraceae bacterium]
MRLLVWNIVLALLWAAMTETFSAPNLVVGYGVGFVVLLMLRSVLQERKYFKDVGDVIGLLIYFVVELFLANLRMAYYTVMPLNRMRPGVIAVPLERMNETELTILSNLITLTPGTLSIDIGEDDETGKQVLYVHVMWYVDPDTVRRDIKKGFEARVLSALR